MVLHVPVKVAVAGSIINVAIADPVSVGKMAARLVELLPRLKLTLLARVEPRSERQARRLGTRDRDCGSRVAARRPVVVVAVAGPLRRAAGGWRLVLGRISHTRILPYGAYPWPGQRRRGVVAWWPWLARFAKG